jgi:hypothetical protein
MIESAQIEFHCYHCKKYLPDNSTALEMAAVNAARLKNIADLEKAILPETVAFAIINFKSAELMKKNISKNEKLNLVPVPTDFVGEQIANFENREAWVSFEKAGKSIQKETENFNFDLLKENENILGPPNQFIGPCPEPNCRGFIDEDKVCCFCKLGRFKRAMGRSTKTSDKVKKSPFKSVQNVRF